MDETQEDKWRADAYIESSCTTGSDEPVQGGSMKQMSHVNAEELMKEFTECRDYWKNEVEENRATKEQAVRAVLQKTLDILDTLRVKNVEEENMYQQEVN